MLYNDCVDNSKMKQKQKKEKTKMRRQRCLVAQRRSYHFLFGYIAS